MKSMTRVLILFASMALGACSASNGDTDLAAVSTLKADLAAVAELGTVVPVDGVTTAGQPNEAQFRVFAEKGYATVIDLRTAGEDRGLDEPTIVAGLGMDYVPFPIGRGDLTFEKAKALDELIAGYDEPVLVHCASANRVGALIALQEYSESGDLDKALAAGRDGGMTRLEDAVRKVIEGE